MVKVLTYDIPDYRIKLKIRQLEVMGKKIQGKLITQAMNGTSVAKCNVMITLPCSKATKPPASSLIFILIVSNIFFV